MRSQALAFLAGVNQVSALDHFVLIVAAAWVLYGVGQLFLTATRVLFGVPRRSRHGERVER